MCLNCNISAVACKDMGVRRNFRKGGGGWQANKKPPMQTKKTPNIEKR